MIRDKVRRPPDPASSTIYLAAMEYFIDRVLGLRSKPPAPEVVEPGKNVRGSVTIVVSYRDCSSLHRNHRLRLQQRVDTVSGSSGSR